MTEYHSIPRINWGSFRGRREKKWGSFRGRFRHYFRAGDHFRGRDHFGGCTQVTTVIPSPFSCPLPSPPRCLFLLPSFTPSLGQQLGTSFTSEDKINSDKNATIGSVSQQTLRKWFARTNSRWQRKKERSATKIKGDLRAILRLRWTALKKN